MTSASSIRCYFTMLMHEEKKNYLKQTDFNEQMFSLSSEVEFSLMFLTVVNMKEMSPVLINTKEKPATYSYGTDINLRKIIRVGPEPREEYLLPRHTY